MAGGLAGDEGRVALEEGEHPLEGFGVDGVGGDWPGSGGKVGGRFVQDIVRQAEGN